jgi:hypothetical protein
MRFAVLLRAEARSFDMACALRGSRPLTGCANRRLLVGGVQDGSLRKYSVFIRDSVVADGLRPSRRTIVSEWPMAGDPRPRPLSLSPAGSDWGGRGGRLRLRLRRDKSSILHLESSIGRVGAVEGHFVNSSCPSCLRVFRGQAICVNLCDLWASRVCGRNPLLHRSSALDRAGGWRIRLRCLTAPP